MASTDAGGGTRAERPPDFTIGPVTVSPARGLLLCGALEEPLSPAMMRLLTVLAERRGAPVARTELMAQASDGSPIEDSALGQLLLRLDRIGLGCRAFTVEPAPRKGYRLRVIGEATPPANAHERVAQALAFGIFMLVMAFVAFWILAHRPGGILGLEL